jgi:hypothetical protein
MDPRRHNPTPGSSAAVRRRRLLVVVVLVAAVVLVAGVVLARRQESSAGIASGSPAASPSASASPSATPLYVRTDRAVKKELLDALPKPPRLLIFGGSRATRFEPSYVEQLTGLRGFNLALQNGRPEDAWAYINYLHRRHPGTRLHVAWFTHVEAFREQGLSYGLIQDRTLSRWFPRALVEKEREKLPRTQAELPRGRDLALTEYGKDGVVLHNKYDVAVERGRKFSRSLEWSIDTALERYATTTPALFARSQRYFEKTLGLLNGRGVTPVIVFMPLHPALLTAVRPAGWDERHREVVAYLDGLGDEYDFCFLDFSELSSFGGDPSAFYDGFHIKQENARKLMRAVVEQCPEAFE